MPFQVSPGVNVSEIDLTTVVPAVSTTTGAVAGVFKWGPVEQPVLISTENELVNTYGKPTSDNFETWFTAANFLSYGNQLYVSRAANSTSYNAIANTAAAANVFVKNATDWSTQKSTIQASAANTAFVAKYPGKLGNSLKISVCPNPSAYSSLVGTTNSTSIIYATIAVGSSTLQVNTSIDYVANTISAALKKGDYIVIGNTTIGTQTIQVANVTLNTANSVTISLAETNKLKDAWSPTIQSNNSLTTRYWEYFNSVDGAPGQSNYVASRVNDATKTDEMHIVVVDEDGEISGVAGEILEVWSHVSRASDARGEQGGSIFWKDVLENNSVWVWPGKDDYTSTTTASIAADTSSVKSYSFANGVDDSESAITVSKILSAYDVFASAEDIDISLILAGRATGTNDVQVANYIIDNICENRKDCVAFISPANGDTVNVPGNELANVKEFRNRLSSSSYAVLDSGHKYQYDRYNDVYRWIPLNGDIGGLCVRTDNVRDPWFSPAGLNRGNIKNVIKLSYNPDKADRDELYKVDINPVVNFPGQGTVLFGDKTLLGRPSAFDRINVRRLFIVLEKAISRAAKSALFEFNDDFTRAAFRNLVEPYLRDIQGRRGIYDFRVVCDTTNNTPEVIDRNEFRGDIYVKPSRSINFIQLNFVAVRTGVEFEEIVGRF